MSETRPTSQDPTAEVAQMRAALATALGMSEPPTFSAANGFTSATITLTCDEGHPDFARFWNAGIALVSGFTREWVKAERDAGRL